jgi:hypothetical protein
MNMRTFHLRKRSTFTTTVYNAKSTGITCIGTNALIIMPLGKMHKIPMQGSRAESVVWDEGGAGDA